MAERVALKVTITIECDEDTETVARALLRQWLQLPEQERREQRERAGYGQHKPSQT
jgi:ribosomal protein L44E